MKTGTHTQVPPHDYQKPPACECRRLPFYPNLTMGTVPSVIYVVECRERLISATQLSLSSQVPDFCLQNQN